MKLVMKIFFVWISRRCSEYGKIKRKIYHRKVLNKKMYKIFQLSIIKFKDISCENTRWVDIWGFILVGVLGIGILFYEV